MLGTLKIGLVLVAVVVVAGCASSVRSIMAPDGRAGFVVGCDGWGEAADLCFSKAREACGGDYDIIARTDETSPTRGLTRRIEVACKA